MLITSILFVTSRLRGGIIILISGGLLFLGTFSSAEAGVIEVYFTEYDVNYTLYTLNDGQNEYVHLDKVTQMFRLSEEIDPIDGRVVLKNDEKTASFFPGQTTVIAERRSHFLEVPPRRIEGMIMIPIQFLTEILPLIYDSEILWDPGKRILQVGIQQLNISDLYASPYGDYTRIVLEMNQAVNYKITEKLPSRLTFELPYSQFSLSQNPLQINSRAVEYVKLINSFGTTQIVMKLGPEFKRYEHVLLEEPPRLVIDVYNIQEQVIETPTPESLSEGIVEETITEEISRDLSIPMKQFSLQTVVIDPGHGGSDPGITLSPATEDVPGIFEKDITLAVAKMLADSLQHRFGEVRVVLTRTGDSFVGAEERTTIANNNRADVFISLHVNNAPTSTVSGFEVYVMDYGSFTLPGGGETLSAQSQVLDYAQARYVESSKQLAEHILAAYNQRNTEHGGRLKSAPLFTLKGATMPAVHVEIGYSSNAYDRAMIVQEEFRQLLVAAITEGIAVFKEQEEQGEQLKIDD